MCIAFSYIHLKKKLLMCPHVVKTVSDGFLDTNSCRLTHMRTTRAGEHDFLSPPLWKINTEMSLSYTLPRWVLQHVLCSYSFIFAVNSSGEGQYESIHFWSAGGPKRLLNTPMLSCQHLQWCIVWAILPSTTHSSSPPSPFPSCYISHNHNRLFMPVPNHCPSHVRWHVCKLRNKFTQLNYFAGWKHPSTGERWQ